jgi:hypothetical protein
MVTLSFFMVASFGFGCDFARLTEARPWALGREAKPDADLHGIGLRKRGVVPVGQRAAAGHHVAGSVMANGFEFPEGANMRQDKTRI